ncbi:hypothetical protein [Geodermatophilus sp. SYSU D01176]
MSRPVRTPWWQQSWLLVVVVVAGSVLVVRNTWTQAWLPLVSTVLTLISIVVGLVSSRRRRDGAAERRPGA